MARTARPNTPRPAARSNRSQIGDIIRASGLTYGEWAQILRVNTGTLYRWSAGNGEPIALAGDIFRAAANFTPAELARFGTELRECLRLEGSFAALGALLSRLCSTNARR